MINECHHKHGTSFTGINLTNYYIFATEPVREG